ncbi:MAG TPA: hypothetical protein DEA08_23885 [Planctomycetes bacterium]|nr:hypothetical protein [Planctomycetota bacterium]
MRSQSSAAGSAASTSRGALQQSSPAARQAAAAHKGARRRAARVRLGGTGPPPGRAAYPKRSGGLRQTHVNDEHCPPRGARLAAVKPSRLSVVLLLTVILPVAGLAALGARSIAQEEALLGQREAQRADELARSVRDGLRLRLLDEARRANTRLREALAARGAEPLLAVHCHDDRGLALANALEAYRAGVDLVDATVLGIGERAGLVDLAQLAVVLTTDFGETSWQLDALPELYRTVSTYSGVPIPRGFPIVGENAFTHCAGVHTHAATRNAVHYQSLDPALVGREMKVSLDHMSGLSSVQYALAKIGAEDAAEDAELSAAVLAEVKRVGEVGRTVLHQELLDILAFCRA